MSEHYTPAWAGALAQIEQPVFFVRDEKIVFQNTAAERLLCGFELKLPEGLLPESMDCYRDFDGNGVLLLMMCLAGLEHAVTVTRGEDGVDIFVAAPSPLCEELPRGLFAPLAQTMRRILNELFDAQRNHLPDLPIMDDPLVRHDTARIDRGICQLVRLANHLADVDALRNGSRRGNFRRVELVSMLRCFCARVQELSRNVEIRFTSSERSMVAAVDQKLLESALLELVSNALRAIQKEGTIVFHLSRKSDRAALQIRDSGAGMEALELAGALGSASHSISMIDDPRRGVGLGLALAYQIAGLHGGTLALQSCPGRGTTALLSFSLIIPESHEEVRAPELSGLDPFLISLSDALPVELFAMS